MPRGNDEIRTPAGTPDSREYIVAVARRAFGASGYDATLRSIAAEAHVDPALVIHYFGTKECVFRAALEITIQPDQLRTAKTGWGFDVPNLEFIGHDPASRRSHPDGDHVLA